MSSFATNVSKIAGQLPQQAGSIVSRFVVAWSGLAAVASTPVLDVEALDKQKAFIISNDGTFIVPAVQYPTSNITAGTVSLIAFGRVQGDVWMQLPTRSGRLSSIVSVSPTTQPFVGASRLAVAAREDWFDACGCSEVLVIPTNVLAGSNAAQANVVAKIV